MAPEAIFFLILCIIFIMNITVLGTGFMGKKHKAVLENLEEVQRIYEVDNHHSKDEVDYYSSVEHFLKEKPQSELVVVATPNYLHFQHAKLLLENGYNVLIEKPFCFKTEEAEILKKTAELHHAKVFLVMQNRYSSVAQLLKSLVETQELGKIYNIQFNAFWNRGKSYYTGDSWKGKKEMDGGILYTQFAHLIDLVLDVFKGKNTIVYKELMSYRNQEISEIEDTVLLLLKNDSGMRCVFNFSTAVYEKNEETSLNIIAEKGTLKISGQYFNEIVYQNVEGRNEIFHIEKNTNEENLTHMYEEVFKALKNQENHSITIDDGIALVKLLQEVYS